MIHKTWDEISIYILVATMIGGGLALLWMVAIPAHTTSPTVQAAASRPAWQPSATIGFPAEYTADQVAKLKQFDWVIREYGFMCESVSGARLWKQTERGPMFKVWCNGDVFVYRAIATPKDGMIVRPWSE